MPTESAAETAAPYPKRSTVAILGVPVDKLSMDEAIQAIEEMICEGGFHQVATANADFLIKAIHDEELYETLCRCDLVLPDGMPLVWASRIMGTPLRERVTGADLVPRLVRLSARRGYRMFLLGAKEENSLLAARWMEQHYPGVCAGRFSPEARPLEEMDNEDILRRIEEVRPDILLVAFGNPKQEKWLAMHRYRLRVPICIGVGAALDFLSGKVSRAPRWMQSSGLEWVYRFVQEPARLARRYIGNAAGLFCYLTVQLVATAMQADRRSTGSFNLEIKASAAVFCVEGSVSGNLLARLETEVRSAILSGRHVVLDLSQTAYLGPDALGSLIHLVATARRWKRELWLTGLRPFLKRVIYATRLRSQFRIAPKTADALRRMEPAPPPLTEKMEPAWAFCRIGDQVIPVRPHEVHDLFLQVQTLVKHNFRTERTSGPGADPMPGVTREAVAHGQYQEILKSLSRYSSVRPARDPRVVSNPVLTSAGSQ
jgi:N-acetylglucosaminyldiphosphoundecaprenol N-acetyl-beta-D-mannosaminyltransferase